MDDAGLRERKKRQTRLTLSRATIGLGVRQGWANLTIDDIAATANVSVRTFRNYFRNKAEAVAHSHLDRMLRIADALRERPDEPLWPAIRAAVLAQFPAAEEAKRPQDSEWTDALRLMLSDPAVQAETLRADSIAYRELAKAIAERLATNDETYPPLVAAVTGAAISVALERWLQEDPSASVVPWLEHTLDQVAAGLPLPEGKS